MLVSKRAKWILFEDSIEVMELHLENLGIKNLALFYGKKNMTRLDQYQAFKERYS